MPTEPTLEATGADHTLLDQGFAPVVPFLDECLSYTQPVTLEGGASIGTHTDLREARDLPCHLLRLLAGASLKSDVFAQAKVQALLRRHFPSREDNFQGATLANESRQPHGSSVNQRHTPPATIDAEVRLFRHYPEIAPESQ